MAQIDYTRKMAMDIARLTKKIEELSKRVSELESVRDRGGTSKVSKLSAESVRKLKESATP